MAGSKLEKPLNDLSIAETRQEIGLAKEQIEKIVMSESNNAGCELVIEELLKSCLVENRLLGMISHL